MNFFALSGLFACVSSLIFGIFSWMKGKGFLNRIWAVFNLSVAIWGLGAFKFSTTLDKDAVFFWLRFGHIGVIFIPVLFLHFVFELLELKKRRVLFITYSIGIFFSILNITDWLGITKLFIVNLRYVFNSFYVDSPPGIIYPFFVAFFFWVIIYAHFCGIKAFRISTGLKRMQIKYFLSGMALSFAGGGTAFLMVFKIDIYPYFHIAVPLYCIVLTYAIHKYRLMDIDLIFRKTIVFAGVFSLVFAIFSGAAYLAESYWANIFGSRFITMGIAVLLIVLIQEPLKDMLVKYTDRFLLQKKYDYQKVLRDASEGMAMVRETKWLLGLITHIISSKMRVSNIGVFLQEDEEASNSFLLKARRGKELIQHPSLSKDNPICLWLKDNRRPLVLEEVDYLLQHKDSSKTDPSDKNILIRIKSQMQSLNSKVIIPAYYKGGLLGFLSLGHKLSGDTYTKEDLILLSTLSSSAAVAIENARLFDSLIDEIEINSHLRKEEEESYMQMMMSLAKTIDAKDSYTYDHVEMVYQYGIDLAQYLPGVNKDALKASLRLHDLGKIGVPDSILSKQGPLTPEEWKVIKDHTILGARILAPLKKFEYVAKIILYHQEKFDGTGYPAGLKGDQIPLESRIISVVDAYHAMVSDRPYRKALPKETAIAELKKFKGSQFDPIVVDAFLKLLKEKHGII